MRAFRWLVPLILVLLAATGCHNSGHAQNTAEIRTVNGVVDSEALDILVDGDAKYSVPAGGTSAFVQISNGTREVVVRSSTTQSILIDKQFSFADGSNNTLVLFGPRSSVQSLLLVDDTTAPSSGLFNFRAVGLSAESGAVDVYLSTTTDVSGATPTVGAVAFGATSSGIQIAAGSYRLVYTVAGTKDVLFVSDPQAFAAGSSYTAMVYPSGGGHLVNAFLLVQGTGGSGTLLLNPQARLKAVNGVTGSTALTFKAESTALLSNVPFAASSNYVTLASGSHTLQVEASNVPGTALATLVQALDPARDHTLLTMGTLAAPTVLALRDDNSFPAAGLARLRFVNGLSDATAADVLLNFATQTSALAAGTASGYYPVTPSTTYTITFTTVGGVAVIGTITPVEIDAGGVYTAYVVGTATAAQARLARDR